MTLNLSSDIQFMPKEKRTKFCPKHGPEDVPNLFGPTFKALHNDEEIKPSEAEADPFGGPVFRMTGFKPGSSDDVILSKSYFRTQGDATENTLIEVRHTPGK